jgi:hypothetical protein
MESKPVVNRAYWEAAFGLPFEADWIPATYDMDEGLDQYLEDLSVSYWLDEEAIYYRLQYQTAYPSRVAMFSASNQEDHLFSFVNEGSVNGSNDWVLGLKREDLRSIGRENTGLLIDLFDSQPFEKRYLRIPYVDEIFMESDRPLYVRSMNVLNFHAVTLSLVEWFEGEWETLDIAYLDGSEDRIQDLQATSLKTDEDIYIHLTYQSRYPADVVFYLPGGQEGLQSRIEGGTGIGENQWTIRLSKEEWETAAAAAGATKVVMNLMLGSLDNPGNIMIEMP